MFDFEYPAEGLVESPEIMLAIVSQLSDAELAALEDDLDFCRFAGVPSHRILAVMDRLGLLDEDWRRLLEANYAPETPPVAWSDQRLTLKCA